MRPFVTGVKHPTHTGRESNDERSGRSRPMPMLLTMDDAAELLRTTRRAIYAMIER